MLEKSLSEEISLHAARQKELLKEIQERHPEIKNALTLLIANFETDRSRFWQESSFYYYTGITEAATVFVQDMEGYSTLYVPNCDNRAQWVYSPVELTAQTVKQFGINELAELGGKCVGYQLFPFFKPENYSNIIERLKKLIASGGKIFTLCPSNDREYIEQRLVLTQLKKFIPNLDEHLVDISDIAAKMRRTKDMHEIDRLYKAVEITELAHEAAAQTIADNVLECEVQASLEYMMTGSAMRPAFPSIVATGKNATILHYLENNTLLKNGELVVVDIGAAYQGYCADITRTYPVSGKFTKRQRDLYNIVLSTQTYIAEIAKPGMYLNNPEHKDESLHHLATEFLKEKGYAQYFVHGIGHYLGLDVHDVGSPREPLKENDVITIEPGIYIPEEEIGIRIEDDYWIAKKGAICLSESLPKEADIIEQMIKQRLRDKNNENRFIGARLSDFEIDEIEH